ncbi:hypothetical protein MRX96_057746, partial [Rhipicephalus microplus]
MSGLGSWRIREKKNVVSQTPAVTPSWCPGKRSADGGEEGPEDAAETPEDAAVPGRGYWARGGAGVLNRKKAGRRHLRRLEPGTSDTIDTTDGRRMVGMARQELLQVAGPRGQTPGQGDPGEDGGGELIMRTGVRWCHQWTLATEPGVAGKERLSTLTTPGGHLLPLTGLERLVGRWPRPRAFTSRLVDLGDDSGEVLTRIRAHCCRQEALTTGPVVAGKKRLVDSYHSRRTSAPAGRPAALVYDQRLLRWFSRAEKLGGPRNRDDPCGQEKGDLPGKRTPQE